jgi:hypothetical protein
VEIGGWHSELKRLLNSIARDKTRIQPVFTNQGSFGDSSTPIWNAVQIPIKGGNPGWGFHEAPMLARLDETPHL